MMLVIGYVERPLDVGIPGVKIGLSNSVLLFAVYMLDLPTAWMLMLMKVGLSGLLFGNLSITIFYALAGGTLSMLAMSILSRIKGIHTVTVSMIAGVMHNLGQVLMAMFLFKTDQLLYYMAVLMLVGLACGGGTGVCATLVMKHLKVLKKP